MEIGIEPENLPVSVRFFSLAPRENRGYEEHVGFHAIAICHRMLTLIPNSMISERQKMIEALKESVVTVLKVRGFKGSFPHFRRPTDTAIHLMTFQFDKWGGGFVVEIARCSVEGIMLRPGEHVPPSKVTAHHVKDRLRLGAVGLDGDHWFRYDQRGLFGFRDPYLKAAREVLALLDSQAESFWNQN